MRVSINHFVITKSKLTFSKGLETSGLFFICFQYFGSKDFNVYNKLTLLENVFFTCRYEKWYSRSTYLCNFYAYVCLLYIGFTEQQFEIRQKVINCTVYKRVGILTTWILAWICCQCCALSSESWSCSLSHKFSSGKMMHTIFKREKITQ